MATNSITSTHSFQVRLLRGERWRTMILAAIWVIAIVVNIVRRELDDDMMASDDVFIRTIVLLSVAVLFQAAMLADATRRLTRAIPLSNARIWLSAGVDLALPTLALFAQVVHAERGAHAPVAVPAILAYPVVIMLSILRLNPRMTMQMGLLGAVAHACVTAFAVVRLDVDHYEWPGLFSYAVFIGLFGIAAAFIALQSRGVVHEAIAEATHAEKTRRSLEEVERDLNIARDIQKSLMPSAPPSMDGYEIVGMARPAQQTGGDYFDWQPLPDGRLAVVVADVTGHGIGPALVMAVCRAYARATAPSAAGAAAMLAHINPLLHEDLGASGRFITMVSAVLGRDGHVDLVSAGHGPTLLYRAASNSIEWFGGDGLPLGIMPDSDYPASTARTMHAGDVLVLLTDGFMEWTRARDGQQFGIQRLADVVKNNAAKTPQQILDALDAGVKEFAEGTPQADDTTAVVIKKN